MKLQVEFTGLSVIAIRDDRKEAGAFILEDACHRAHLVFQEASLVEFQPQNLPWTRPLRPIEAPGQPLAFEFDISGLEVELPPDKSNKILATNQYAQHGYPMKPPVPNWSDLSQALNLDRIASGKAQPPVGLAGAVVPIFSGALTALTPTDPRMASACWSYKDSGGAERKQGIADRIQLEIDAAGKTVTLNLFDRSTGLNLGLLTLRPFLPQGEIATIVVSSQCPYPVGAAQVGMPDVQLYKRCLTAGAKITTPLECADGVASGSTPNATRCPPVVLEYT